jgi:hypothetical protein
MSEDGRYMFLIYAEFLGIGYIRDNQGWHISVLFQNPGEAKQVWDAEFKNLDGKRITISFIETPFDYKFFVYSTPLKKMPVNNFSLYRSLDISQNYIMFKKGFNGKVMFEFAIVSGPQPAIFSDYKTITDVKFTKLSEVKPNSPEWLALQVQKKAREDGKKSGI